MYTFTVDKRFQQVRRNTKPSGTDYDFILHVLKMDGCEAISQQLDVGVVIT